MFVFYHIIIILLLYHITVVVWCEVKVSDSQAAPISVLCGVVQWGLNKDMGATRCALSLLLSLGKSTARGHACKTLNPRMDGWLYGVITKESGEAQPPPVPGMAVGYMGQRGNPNHHHSDPGTHRQSDPDTARHAGCGQQEDGR